MRYILAVCVLLLAVPCFAETPEIRWIRGETANGSRLSISGENFGENVAVQDSLIAWTGGPDGWIEQAPVGSDIRAAQYNGDNSDGNQYGFWWNHNLYTQLTDSPPNHTWARIGIEGTESPVPAYSGSKYINASIDQTGDYHITGELGGKASVASQSRSFAWLPCSSPPPNPRDPGSILSVQDSLAVVYGSFMCWLEPKNINPAYESGLKWWMPVRYGSHPSSIGTTQCWRFYEVAAWVGESATGPYTINKGIFSNECNCGNSPICEDCCTGVTIDPFHEVPPSGDGSCTVNCLGVWGFQYYPGSISANAPRLGEWFRKEFYLVDSSPDGADGVFSTWITRPGETRNHIMTLSDLTTRGVCYDEVNPTKDRHLGQLDNAPLGMLYWENFAQAIGGWSTQAWIMNYDDLYIQVGTQARVELGNAPVYADCTALEIQYVTNWCDPCQGNIQFTLNRGRSNPDGTFADFPNGSDAYVFVIDDNGDVSAGKKLRLPTPNHQLPKTEYTVD